MSRSANAKKSEKTEKDQTEKPRRRLKLAPRRRLGVLGIIGLGGLVVILFAIVAFQAFIVGNQSELDDLKQRIDEAKRNNQQLRYEVAELQSPDRILRVATDQLGMLQPEKVIYLPPISAAALEPSDKQWVPNPDDLPASQSGVAPVFEHFASFVNDPATSNSGSSDSDSSDAAVAGE